ncbi:hypothetical protein L1887_55099 [Cichorium endivia]|nr:hypothetical protein L1887_55099 [Cichorium endivia]
MHGRPSIQRQAPDIHIADLVSVDALALPPIHRAGLANSAHLTRRKMTRSLIALAAAAVLVSSASAQNKPDFNVNNLPDKWEANQSGSNQCKKWGASSGSSLCQNVFINNANDFCLWGPMNPNSQIGANEESVVSYCLKSGYGTRPDSQRSDQGRAVCQDAQLSPSYGSG